MNTITIITGPHYPKDWHRISNADPALTDSLRRMARRRNWTIQVKEGGKP